MLKQELKRFTENYTKIIFLCIGNDMRGDDSVGPMLANDLTDIFKTKDNIIVLNTKTVPENFTGLIRHEDPSHIILLDAVEMNKNPGFIKLIQMDEIENYSISTHAMPVSFLIKYLESIINAKIVLIGIQPKNLEINNTVSAEVKMSVKKLTKIISTI